MSPSDVAACVPTNILCLESLVSVLPHIHTNILCLLFACIIKCTRQLALCITVALNQARVYTAPSTWILALNAFKVYSLTLPSWWFIVSLMAVTAHFPTGYYCLWCLVHVRVLANGTHLEAYLSAWFAQH